MPSVRDAVSALGRAVAPNPPTSQSIVSQMPTAELLAYLRDFTARRAAHTLPPEGIPSVDPLTPPDASFTPTTGLTQDEFQALLHAAPPAPSQLPPPPSPQAAQAAGAPYTYSTPDPAREAEEQQRRLLITRTLTSPMTPALDLVPGRR